MGVAAARHVRRRGAGLCFGRIDVETMRDPLYVGRRWVHDDGHDVLVVNWQAPAARPFYTATPVAPHGVTLRRRFRTEGRRLVDISDEALAGSLEGGAAAVDDFLLEELERSRDAHMRDIVATIQADQYRLIARDPAPPLVIQGGPGTGKTAVGLHRASFLLYTHREELRADPGRRAEPDLHGLRLARPADPRRGERRPAGRDRAGRRRRGEPPDPPDVERLKADLRMAAVVGGRPSSGWRRGRSRSRRGSTALSCACAKTRSSRCWRRSASEHGLDERRARALPHGARPPAYAEYTAKLGAQRVTPPPTRSSARCGALG